MPNPFSADLAAAQYSTGSGTVAAFALDILMGGYGPAPIAGIIRDGDFTVAAKVGQPTFEFPFEQHGDSKAQLLYQRYWQLAANFRSLALGSPAPNRADLLLVSEADPRDEGGGIISWTRTYANIPSPHDEWESHTYGFQYFTTSVSTGLQLKEWPIPVPSRVRYEYFHIKDLDNWPIIQAPRIFPLADRNFQKIGTGNLAVAGSYIVSSDAQILAEATSFKVWKYPIMERRSRYIAGPTLEFFGSEFSVSL